MDKDKKLEEFFKKRVNDFDSSNDDWDKPVPSVFQNAKVHFPKHPRPVKRDWKIIALLLLTLILMGLLGSLYFINRNVNEAEKNIIALENKLKDAETEIQNLNFSNKKNQSSSLDEKFVEENPQLSSQKEITSQTTETLNRKNQKLQKNIAIQKQQIESLIFDNQLLSDQINERLSTSIILNLEKEKVNNEVKSDSIPLREKINLIAVLPSQNISFLQTRKKDFQLEINPILFSNTIYPPVISDIKNKNFEIGLGYSSIFFDVPVAYDFKKLEPFEKGKEKSISNKRNGLNIHLGYHILPNLWLNTGFIKSKGLIEQDYSTLLKYDKSQEYIDNGKIFNEFELSTQSSFTDDGNQVGFEVPTGTNISDEEVLVTKWKQSQEIKMIHIPLGLTYFGYLSRKFQWMASGGFGWNQATLGNYEFDASVFYKNDILPIKKIDLIKESKSKSNFINGSIGLGLNYKLTDNWNLRTSYSFERNFKKSKKAINNSSSKTLNFSLNYRF